MSIRKRESKEKNERKLLIRKIPILYVFIIFFFYIHMTELKLFSNARSDLFLISLLFIMKRDEIII
jgi:hypothetical protein